MSDDLARTLLDRAREDAAAVASTLSIAEVTDAIIGFHAQQAVEKALKAVLTIRGLTFPFTHDLEGLMESCLGNGIRVPAHLTEGAGSLTPYAARHRYGADLPTLVDRAEAFRLATTAIDWAAGVIAAHGTGAG